MSVETLVILKVSVRSIPHFTVMTGKAPSLTAPVREPSAFRGW